MKKVYGFRLDDSIRCVGKPLLWVTCNLPLPSMQIQDLELDQSMQQICFIHIVISHVPTMPKIFRYSQTSELQIIEDSQELLVD